MTSAAHSLPDAPPGRLEKLFIFVSLLLVTQALTPLLLMGVSSDETLSDSNPGTLLSALLVYAIAFFLVMRRPAAMVRTIVDDWLLLAVFALPLLSVVWSVDHGTSARRVVALLMTGLYCVYIARRLSPDDFLRHLLLALFAGGVASLIYTGLDPRHAIEQSAINNGSWKGVYGHKAILGRIAAIAVTVSVYVKPRTTLDHVIRWATIAIFLFLAVQSQSRASWLMMLGGFAFMFLMAVLRNQRFSSGIKLAVALCMGLAVLAATAVMFENVLAAFGRDDTFSGRTSLWHGAVAVANANHPVLGAGYRAFWTNTGAAEVRDYIQGWGRLPGHGHNGYLDVWLELGWAGVVLFGVFLLTMIVRLARRVLRAPEERAWAAFSIFFFVFILNNFSVTVAFKHTDIAWVAAILACLYTHGCVTARLPVMTRAGRRNWRGVPHLRPAPAFARGAQFSGARS
jgi:O-antigen ligase